MKLYFRTKNYRHTDKSYSIAIDTGKKLYTLCDYYDMWLKFNVDSDIHITITEYKKLLKKVQQEGYERVQYIDED